MAISYVNGFLCESSCDIAKAKKGVDPHPKADALVLADKSKANASASAAEPAVTFGGTLANLTAQALSPVSATPAATAAGAATTRIDLLV